MLQQVFAVAVLLAVALHARADIDFDSTGQARAIVQWPATIPFKSSVWIARDGWQSIVQQSQLQDIDYRNKSISGTLIIGKQSIAFEQSTRELPTATHIDYELSSKSNIMLDGVYWFGSIYVERFGGGTVTIGNDRTVLPKVRGVKDLASGSSDRIRISDETGEMSIEIKFDRQLKITVQDAREFGANVFQIYVPVLENEIRPGEHSRLGVSISATSPKDNAPARIEVDTDRIVSSFDGFGGNFVYDIDNPATDFNLRTLQLTWARLGMNLIDWEPTNDNASPSEADEDWGRLIDTPTSNLRKRFQLDKRVYELSGERTIVSAWRLPEWLYDTPLLLPPGRLREVAGRVKPEMWPELIECITTYLIHLKNNYGVEPGYFSFNEPDYGIYLSLNGDELNLLYQQLGKAFETAGLGTKLLLPDSATLNQGLQLMQPALKNPQTMKYVGALAYHAWSGEQNLWDSWAKIAETYKLPLLVTEAGLDANAWRDSSYNKPINMLRLAERYVQLLRASGAQGIMEWEWTGDYSLSHLDDGVYRPSSRYWMMWQFTRNTPQFGNVAETASNQISVNGAIILSGEPDKPAFSLHVSNTGQQRKVTVAGLPRIEGKLTVITTEFLTDRPPSVEQIDFPKVELQLDVPAGSLVTITTLPVEEPKR